ncbi:hypothetical protein M8C21_023484 [Ambrosia artemisiifolia]|uniref:SHSP domain-containing protein n=1 Tax=Ambrosia artemisiifolia TaxID=4212 RepID=A0AAD5G2W0_AMBAR|nr:hypothetical protein M8C21_023484 [Ambrosia artemisiifolia]
MMASKLLRLTKSVLRPPVPMPVSSNRLPPIHCTRQHYHNTRSFSSSTTPLPKCTVKFDLPFLFSQMEMAPSMLFTLVNDQELTLTMPGLKQTEDEEGLWLSFDVPNLGLRVLKMYFHGFNFLIQLKTPQIMYLATIKLPQNYNPYGDLKGKCEDGVCYICLPTQKTIDPVLAKANINRELTRPTRYCEMFHRSDIGLRLCGLIAHPEVNSKSFTVYKKDDGESIFMKGNLPGVESIVVTSDGLCVSLDMPGFKIEEVEVGFEYDTMIIEGKREREHYIAGVQVPEGFQREDRLIKKEMQDGVFKATLPRGDGKRLVFSVYR